MYMQTLRHFYPQTPVSSSMQRHNMHSKELQWNNRIPAYQLLANNSLPLSNGAFSSA
jgi:hypothetical protein